MEHGMIRAAASTLSRRRVMSARAQDRSGQSNRKGRVSGVLTQGPKKRKYGNTEFLRPGWMSRRGACVVGDANVCRL
jgi:hypothetical protein